MQSRIYNPETLTTLGTHDTGQRQTKDNITPHNTFSTRTNLTIS